MEYTVWPDSSDPPVDIKEQQNTSTLDVESTLNVSLENNWDDTNLHDSYNITPSLKGEVVAQMRDNRTSGFKTDLQNDDRESTPNNWNDEFTQLNDNSLDERVDSSFVNFPIDEASNSPIHNDASFLDNIDIKPNQKSTQNRNFIGQEEMSPQHRRGFSEAYSMRVPLVEPSHLDEPQKTSRSGYTQLKTNYLGDEFSPGAASAVFNTPRRMTPGSAENNENHHSPPLNRDSPTNYLSKGLESPLEYSGLESPYTPYPPFPVLPHSQTKPGRRMTTSSNRKRTSSSESQHSMGSAVASVHDSFEQPDTPLSRPTNQSFSYKTMSTGAGADFQPTATPRASNGSKNSNIETPRANIGERAWNTPTASISPLSTQMHGHVSIMDNNVVRTPSTNRVSVTSSTATPTLGKSNYGTPSLPHTPSFISPSQEDKATPVRRDSSSKAKSNSNQNTPTQQTWKKDGRRRIGRKEIEILEDFFHKNPHPERSDRERLAEMTKLEQRTVQIWFQNRRAKTRALKMPPSRADKSEEANHYRAAAAAAAAAGNTPGTSKRRNTSPNAKSKTKTKGGSGTTSMGSPYSVNDVKSTPTPNFNLQRSQSISSPLSNINSSRTTPVRPTVSRSRSAFTPHHYSLSNNMNYFGPENPSMMNTTMTPTESMSNADFSNYDLPQDYFQYQNMPYQMPRPTSMGSLENIPEGVQRDPNLSWKNNINNGPGIPVGYHQQLSTNYGNAQKNGLQNFQMYQRMLQYQRFQHGKLAKNKSSSSFTAEGINGTRGRSSSMYEPMTQYFNEDIDSEFMDNTMNNFFPSRSGSIASLQSTSPAIPRSPMLESQAQFSPDLTSLQNSPDMFSGTWSTNSMRSGMYNEEWNQNGQAFSAEESVAGWSMLLGMNEPFPPIQQQQHQNMNINDGGIQRNGLAASAAAATLKGSQQRRNSVQSNHASRKPSIRLQLDESNNAAQLVVVPAENDPSLPRFLDETDWVHDHLAQEAADNSPGRAEKAAKLLIGEKVASTSHDSNAN